MSNSKKLSDKEIREDMGAMLKSTVDFERTMGMINLNEDELLIFKRAARQLKKADPNMQILRKAYDIFIVKSYSNSAGNHYDTQSILGEDVRRGFFSGLFDSTAIKFIFATIVLLIVLNFFTK